MRSTTRKRKMGGDDDGHDRRKRQKQSIAVATIQTMGLPEELIVHIFSVLCRASPEELANVSYVCKCWRQMVHNSFSMLTHMDFSKASYLCGKRVLSALRRIEHLNLSRCKVVRHALMMSVTVRNLRTLSMPKTRITDDTIKLIASQAKNLYFLDISECQQLTNASLVAIGAHLRKITHLLLPKCWKIDQHGVIQLVNLEALHTLDIRGLHLSQISAEQVVTSGDMTPHEPGNGLTAVLRAHAHHLKDLRFKLQVDCMGDTIAGIKSCIFLERLELCSASRLQSSALESLAEACSNVKHLYVEEAEYAVLPLKWSLESLHLKQCLHVKNMLLFMKQSPNLTSLALGRCYTANASPIKGKGYQIACKNLQTLDLSRASPNFDTLFKLVLYHCHQLRYLNVQGWVAWKPYFIKNAFGLLKDKLPIVQLNMSETEVTDATLKLILKWCTKVQVLNLAKCGKLTDLACEYIIPYGRQLEVLDLSFCPRIQGTAIGRIAEKCTGLTHLNLANIAATYDVTPKGNVVTPRKSKRAPYVKKLALFCKKLRELKLSSNVGIDDDAVATLLKFNSNLEVLELAAVPGITNKTMTLLATSPNTRNLKELDVSQNIACSATLLEPLLQHCPKLSRLVITAVSSQVDFDTLEKYPAEISVFDPH